LPHSLVVVLFAFSNGVELIAAQIEHGLAVADRAQRLA
jgi:hypothetical protein